MSATPPPGYTPPPADLPIRSDRSTFSGRVDAWVTWFSTVILSQLSAMIANAYANALDAFSSASASSASAISSANSAAASASYASASLWISGATYAIGAAARDPVNLLVYIRRTAGAGTTPPRNDLTNWQASGNLADDFCHLVGLNGYGTISTCVRRYSNVRAQAGNSILLTDSALYGTSFTILQRGIYSLSISDTSTVSTGANVIVSVGMSKNISGTMGSTQISLIPLGNRLLSQTSSTANPTGGQITFLCTVTLTLDAGDVLYTHNYGTNVASNSSDSNFVRVQRISGVV